MYTHFYFFLLLLFFCFPGDQVVEKADSEKVSLVVLGNIQDAGSPHIACDKACCADLFNNPDPTRKIVSLGLIDHQRHRTYLFEATPHMPEQMKFLKELAHSETEVPNGIFLTHAHIGHYTGLMYLGKEAMNAKEVPVYVMPRMKTFLEENGPWSQLVSQGQIKLQTIFNQTETKLGSTMKVIPVLVPHRDEYSETVGYTIIGPHKKALFIPDIDKWEKWDQSIIEYIKKVDYAFIDATFYDEKEISYRAVSEIPHPFVIESMAKFQLLGAAEKSKIFFIHLNHTNPLLNPESSETKEVLKNGFKIARYGDVFEL